jgi:hypothetical protein
MIINLLVEKPIRGSSRFLEYIQKSLDEKRKQPINN